MIAPLPASVRCPDSPGSVSPFPPPEPGFRWRKSSTLLPRKDFSRRNSLKPPRIRGEKTHSGALRGGCLAPCDGAEAGGRLQSLHQLNNWQLPGYGGRLRNPLVGCGRRSCSISKFWAGHLSPHSPPTFPSLLKIQSRAMKCTGKGKQGRRPVRPQGTHWPLLSER